MGKAPRSCNATRPSRETRPSAPRLRPARLRSLPPLRYDCDPPVPATQPFSLILSPSGLGRRGPQALFSEGAYFLFLSWEAMEEMKRLQGLRAETLVETCQSTESRDGAIRCPIPCKSSRWYREREFAHDLSDFILSKASPPYFMGSPPVRATNPLVHDAQFCAWEVQSIDQSPGIPIPTKGAQFCAWKVQSVDQSPGIPIPTKGYNARYCARKGSVTKA
ncbi:hypothetical protein BAE44_0016687 [Dichanthelium oligosanthes]|uniref:Uncharacterized protein n=1 Tax=Dichanthelium oligosanthes TaxID=888268 RepID=A0A1E5VB83_9POAL|nr:hypothetical protein BAE44_0016687 [Dichanthelium oligosanthes]